MVTRMCWKHLYRNLRSKSTKVWANCLAANKKSAKSMRVTTLRWALSEMEPTSVISQPIEPTPVKIASKGRSRISKSSKIWEVDEKIKLTKWMTTKMRSSAQLLSNPVQYMKFTKYWAAINTQLVKVFPITSNPFIFNTRTCKNQLSSCLNRWREYKIW